MLSGGPSLDGAVGPGTAAAAAPHSLPGHSITLIFLRRWVCHDKLNALFFFFFLLVALRSGLFS